MWVAHPAAAPGEVTPIPGLTGAGGSALAHRDSGVTLARPLAAGEQIDLDRAPALEIARLPKVGPRLAKTIVADREARGPFGSLAALDRVPGVGSGLLAAIAPYASFGGPPGPPAPGAPTPGPPTPGPPTAGPPSSVAGPSSRSGAPGGAPNSGSSSGAGPPVGSGFLLVDLNSASAAELETLPFIGPGLALRIVAFRERHGRFPAVDSLVRVPGIGPSVLARVRDRVVAR
jgi:competence ComEA-like helix-hairpin-helix protein